MKTSYICSLFLLIALLQSITLQAQNTSGLLLAEGKFSEAIELLNQKTSPLNPTEQYHLALAYQQCGYPDKAITILTKDSAQLNNQQIDLLCRCYLKTGNYPKALPICQNKYKQSPLDASNLMRLAEINGHYKEYQNNIRVLGNYLKHDTLNYNINILLAENYYKAKNMDKAIATYQMVLQQYPNNEKVALKLAQLHYGQKQYVECHDLCVPFIKKLDKNKNFLLIAGLANFKNGSNSNVLVMFNRLESKGDSSFLTKKHLGITYYRLENYQKAIQHLHAAINYKDLDPEVAFFLGASYGQTIDPLKGKPYLELAQELIQPSPDLMEKTNIKLAMMHYDTGHYEKAINYYCEAYNYAPERPYYLYQQASIYDYKVKDAKKAQELYNKFLLALPDSLNPQNGNDLYAIKLKKLVNNRLVTLKEEDFFKNGI